MQEKDKIPLLYVENAPYRDRFAIDLENYGFKVTIRQDRESAEKIFDKDVLNFQIGLIDLGLPRRNIKGEIIQDNDPSIGVELLLHLREKSPDINLIAYTMLPAREITRKMFTQLIAAKVSIVPFNMFGHTNDLQLILEIAKLGYVTYPPQFATLVVERIIPPDLLDNWEYRILEMRVQGNTLNDISEKTNILLDTIRADFKSIYGKLEDSGLIDEPAKDKRRDPKDLIDAYRSLSPTLGAADQTWERPLWRRQYKKRTS